MDLIPIPVSPLSPFSPVSPFAPVSPLAPVSPVLPFRSAELVPEAEVTVKVVPFQECVTEVPASPLSPFSP